MREIGNFVTDVRRKVKDAVGGMKADVGLDNHAVQARHAYNAISTVYYGDDGKGIHSSGKILTGNFPLAQADGQITYAIGSAIRLEKFPQEIYAERRGITPPPIIWTSIMIGVHNDMTNEDFTYYLTTPRLSGAGMIRRFQDGKSNRISETDHAILTRIRDVVTANQNSEALENESVFSPIPDLAEYFVPAG